MHATALRIRVALFFLISVIPAALGWSAAPVSSQPESHGRLQPHPQPIPASAGAPFTLTGPGHIDMEAIVRVPSGGWASRVAEDKIVFTGDILGGLAVHIAGAELHDRWTWLYYIPDGTLYSDSCWMEIRAPGEEGNNTPYVALVTNCPTVPGQQWQVLETFAAGCPCTSAYLWTLGVPIAGYPAESEVGTWAAFVDYTDPGGLTTPGVAEDNMYLMYTPAVVVVHGWESSCGFVEPLLENLRETLAVTADRVACFKDDDRNGYNVRKGVDDNATALAGGAYSAPLEGRFGVRDLRRTLELPPEAEVDLVGHSYGGLVARFYRRFRYDAVDGPIGSISMLGTPNEGVNLAAIAKLLCDAPGFLDRVLCDPISWGVEQIGHVDLGSDAVKDMTPDSKILKRLNDGFVLPESPVYRAHAGGRASVVGYAVSGSADNDCLVARDSVDGPNVGDSPVFGPPRLFEYEELTHGATIPGPPPYGCDAPSLVDSQDVVDDLVVTIKGRPAGGEPLAEPLPEPQASGPGARAAFAGAVRDVALPSQQNNHLVSVPPGLGDTAFVVYWLDADVEPVLSVTVRRPDGSMVSPTDPDVIGEINVSGDSFLNVLMRGFVISAPQPGLWEITVDGTSVPEQGQPYLVALMPASQVMLSADTTEPALPQGQPEVIKATLFDGTTAIASSSASAHVITPGGAEEDVTLHDDGIGGDEVAGDLTYSGTFTSTADCGGYSILVTATGDSSEGTVTRHQFAFFQSQVPGDAVRDPCNPDDDDDLLTDADELDIYHTDPLSTDTDADGFSDGDEVLTYGTDPLDPDTDGDDALDGTDNCPLASNPGQENADAAIGNGTGIAGHDATVPNGDPTDTEGDACETDGDADNDGIPDASDPDPGGDITYDDDMDGDPCVPLGSDAADDGPSWDADCNGVLDGFEAACPLAVDPNGDDRWRRAPQHVGGLQVGHGPQRRRQ